MHVFCGSVLHDNKCFQQPEGKFGARTIIKNLVIFKDM